MALEIFENVQQGLPYTEAVDEWAIGVVIFELSSLKRPVSFFYVIQIQNYFVKFVQYEAYDIEGLKQNLKMSKMANPFEVIKNAEIRSVVKGLLTKDPKTRLTARQALDQSPLLKRYDAQTTPAPSPVPQRVPSSLPAAVPQRVPSPLPAAVPQSGPVYPKVPSNNSQSPEVLKPVKVDQIDYKGKFQELQKLRSNNPDLKIAVVRDLTTDLSSIICRLRKSHPLYSVFFLLTISINFQFKF